MCIVIFRFNVILWYYLLTSLSRVSFMTILTMKLLKYKIDMSEIMNVENRKKCNVENNKKHELVSM